MGLVLFNEDSIILIFSSVIVVFVLSFSRDCGIDVGCGGGLMLVGMVEVSISSTCGFATGDNTFC